MGIKLIFKAIYIYSEKRSIHSPMMREVSDPTSSFFTHAFHSPSHVFLLFFTLLHTFFIVFQTPSHMFLLSFTLPHRLYVKWRNNKLQSTLTIQFPNFIKLLSILKIQKECIFVYHKKKLFNSK